MRFKRYVLIAIIVFLSTYSFRRLFTFNWGLNITGGGLLVELMKRATQNKQYAEIDHAIKTKVK